MREGITLDVAGNVWTHPAVDLKKDDRSDAVILTFSCDRIQTESTSEGERPYTYLVFLDALEFPENVTKTTTVESGGALHSQAIRREGSKGSVSGMHVSYDARRNMPGEKYSEFFARASDGTSVPPNFQDRLLEALRFCTATMAAPVMSETLLDNVKVIELAKSRPLNNSGIVHAPISCSRPDFSQDFYKLFEC